MNTLRILQCLSRLVLEAQLNPPIDRRAVVLGAATIAPALVVDKLLAFSNLAPGDHLVSAKSLAGPQHPAEKTKPEVLVFDVNQTLLDLNALRSHFARIFGDAKTLDEWFTLLLQYSLVVTVTGAYADFGTVAGAVLDMLAANRKVNISPEDRRTILRGLLSLPAHPEVPESLQRLREAGFRMVTLTNSSPAAVRTQIENSGLTKYFDESISVDLVRRFKPDLEVYQRTAEHLGVPPANLLLVAAHAWDVFGALKAGWRAAFVSRNGITQFPLGPKADIVGPDLKTVADAILT